MERPGPQPEKATPPPQAAQELGRMVLDVLNRLANSRSSGSSSKPRRRVSLFNAWRVSSASD